MHLSELARLLPPAVRDQLESLFEQFSAENGSRDLEWFLAWLHKRGHLDEAGLRAVAGRADVTVPPRGSFRREAEPEDLREDPKIDYEAHGVVGTGAMGLVHLVRDRRLGRMVALKTMDRDLARDPELAARFVTEVQVTAQLEHPNIVPVYRMLDTKTGAAAYTMKLIRGESVRDYLNECLAQERSGRVVQGYRLEDRLEHFLKVCSAMAYAHSRGVLHRDLKPPNVMVGPFGEVYVMDWGIARVQGVDETLTGGGIDAPEKDHGGGATEYGQAMGTPSYMSPEQAQGRLDELGPASDQYALGLILFELVTLKKARAGHGVEALLALARDGDKAPMEHVMGRPVPRELVGIVDRATALKPEQRYRDLDALAEDVRRFLRGEEVRAAPDSRFQRAARWLAHNRLRALTAVLTLVALAGLVSTGSLATALRVRSQAAAHSQTMADLVGAVSRQGRRVDDQLRDYEALLESLAGATMHVLSGPDAVHPRPSYLSGDYDAGQTVPADLGPAPRYAQPVSFAHPVFKLAPGVQAHEVGPQLRRLGSLQPDLRRLFVRSAPGLSELLGTDLVPVVWSYVALEAGVHMSYPGHGGYPADYDPRVRPWYRAARDADGPTWTRPYPDVNGLGVMFPVNMALRDDDGRLMGVAGVELTFDHVVAVMNSEGELDGLEARTALLDSSGAVIVASDADRPEFAAGLHGNQAVDAELFDVAEVVQGVLEGRSGSLRSGDEVVVYDRMLSLDWTFVVRVNAARLGL